MTRRRTVLRVSTERVIVVSRSGRSPLAWCERCNDFFELAPPAHHSLRDAAPTPPCPAAPPAVKCPRCGSEGVAESSSGGAAVE
jgi:hypothetical protein